MSTQTATKTAPFAHGDCYKYEWARFVAKRTLEKDLQAVKARILQRQEQYGPQPGIPWLIGTPGAPGIPISEETSLTDLYNKTKPVTGGGIVPPELGKFKVGIVGAGVAGLFTGLLLDWLNEKLEGKLQIDYDIIEAADTPRLGGRLFTHRFSEDEHDYYDIGAMRFPDNNIMHRTFRLFNFLGLEKNKRGGLVPYYLGDKNDVCPAYFNDVPTVGDIWKRGVVDPYRLNEGLPEDEKIPVELLKTDPSELTSNALREVIKDVKETMDRLRAAGSDADKSQLWAKLMKMDHMSTRQFFSSVDNGEDFPKGPGFNFNTIEWLECVTAGTALYNQSLTECIMDELDFEEGEGFWCVDGGGQKIATLMSKLVNKPIQFNSQVTAIDANIAARQKYASYVPMTLKISQTKTKATRTEDYLAVFNSTTLGALQRMDLKDAGLLWGTKQAIRNLGYDASSKVAIKFKTPWWQLAPFSINKGGVSRTDLPLRVCVYPSYNIESDLNPEWSKDKPSVLLCSYTWGQDALRIGSLITPDSPAGEEQLKKTLLHNLALLHANEHITYERLLKFLNEQYVTHHGWDWYRDQNASGAFAYFGPGQFSNMWEEIIKPNAFGQLYLVGEAASAHHAWIVGALESVVRAVYVMLEGLEKANYCPEFTAYRDAMKLLRTNSEEGLPFYPLPREMPKHLDSHEGGAQPALATTISALTAFSGKSKEGEKKEEHGLSYASGLAMLCQIESLFESLEFK
ncbi:hypothetical protein VP1G_09904 [Cytospora mali]|uniref:Amine oxidase domain-containing protein n=1 Tax=Cytospora mali TaxID=578113 RepID=A0A194VFK0_CYTMA|nr:hypothetical protein VP1G_09904 [Valsa mali var. pyri (nom. inval.)]